MYDSNLFIIFYEDSLPYKTHSNNSRMINSSQIELFVWWNCDNDWLFMQE